MNKLLCLTLAGTDPDTVRLMLNEGALPALGVLHARLNESKLAWNHSSSYLADWLSVATGAHAWRHGVIRTALAKPLMYGVAPASRLDLLAEPAWEMLATADYPTASVGWPATQHSFSDNADIYSDAFFTSSGSADRFPVFAGSFNARRSPRKRIALRQHADSLPAEIPTALRETLAKNSGKVAVARALLNEDCKALFLHMDLLEPLGLPNDEVQAMSLLKYYQVQDELLAPVLDAADQATTVVVVFRPPSAAFKTNPQVAKARGAVWFSASGRFGQTRISTLTPTDVLPWVGALVGAPLKASIDGTRAAAETAADLELDLVLRDLSLPRTEPLLPNRVAAEDALRRAQYAANKNYEQLNPE